MIHPESIFFEILAEVAARADGLTSPPPLFVEPFVDYLVERAWLAPIRDPRGAERLQITEGGRQALAMARTSGGT